MNEIRISGIFLFSERNWKYMSVLLAIQQSRGRHENICVYFCKNYKNIIAIR